MNTRVAAAITAVGGLCALCCVIPIAGFLGLGALEAFFCDSPWAIGMGIGIMTIGLALLAFKYYKGSCAKSAIAANCSVGCGCNAS